MHFVALAFVIGVSTPLLAQQFVPGTDSQPYPPHKMIGNIYYVGTNDVTSFLITTPAGHILIDSGYEATVPIIEAAVQRVGFKMSDIKILLNSHAHIDHVAGMSALKKLTGAKLYVSEADAPVVESGGDFDFRWSKEYRWPKCVVDRKLKDLDKVELGGVTLIAHITPGHSMGATTWTMLVKDGTKTYNVVFLSSATINPGVVLTPGIAGFTRPGIAEDYARSFKIWRSLPCDVFLGAHAAFFQMQRKYETPRNTSEGSAYVDPEGYKRHLDLMEKRFKDQLTAEAAMPKLEAPPKAEPKAKPKKKSSK